MVVLVEQADSSLDIAEAKVTMDAMSTSLMKLMDSYRKWIITNPQVLSDIESTVRCLSYFSAGRFTNSSFVSELVYSMPNLLVLFNDLLLYSAKRVPLKFHSCQSKIKVWLMVLQYTETLFEVSAIKFGGQKGRWIVITVVQLCKAILRLMLVHVYEERITKNPPIQPFNRDNLNDCSEEKSNTKEGFTLKRSKTVVRCVRSSSAIELRSWEPLTLNAEDYCSLNDSSISKKKLLLAETLYILKPLIHLGCVSATGMKQWPPWLLALAIDLTSLRIFKDESKAMPFSNEDKKEFFRRRLSLVLYILRSPFYEKYSSVRIYALLNLLSAKVPFARLLAEPLKKYLPHWQGMYFYTWSS